MAHLQIRLRWLPFCALLGLSVFLTATSTLGVRADEAPKIMRMFDLIELRSGFQPQAGEFAKMVLDRPGDLGDVRAADVRKLSNRLFDPDAMLADTATQLSGKLTAAELDAAIAFFETDVGRRMSAAERRFNALPDQDDRVAVGARAFDRMARKDRARAAVYRALKSATRFEEVVNSSSLNLLYAFVSGMSEAPGQARVGSEAELLEIVNASASNIAVEAKAYAKGAIAVTYRESSVEDLKAYAAFYRTPEGTAYLRQTQKAVERMMIARARAFGYEFMVLQGLRRG